MRDNVHTTWNLLEAAERLGIPRVVLASSWRAARMQFEACVDESKTVSDPATASPLSAYGLSKATAEEAGRMAVHAGHVDTFVAARIGRVVWKPPRPPEDSVNRRRAIGVADLRMLLRLSLERRLNGFHVIYGISPTSEAVVDLRATRRLLDWSPNDVPEDPSLQCRVTQTA
jgi:nucleoside-diphosphate-sugar epimerase